MSASSDNSRSTPVAGFTTRSQLIFAAAALLLVAALGLLNLHYPFVHDQLAVIYAAKSIANGGTLYVNFWDNKLPGLVWFYFVAGKLFGFSESGIHTLELIWMLSFSAILIAVMRRQLLIPASAAAAPLATVGVYYVAADPFQLTQIEFTIGLPVFISLWLTSRIDAMPKKRAVYYFFAGVFAGITIVFKLVYAPFFCGVLEHCSTLRTRFTALLRRANTYHHAGASEHWRDLRVGRSGVQILA